MPSLKSTRTKVYPVFNTESCKSGVKTSIANVRAETDIASGAKLLAT